MVAAMAVFWLGVGVGFLGLLAPDLYVIAVVIMVIGAIGVAVRLVDWFLWLRGPRRS